MTIALTLVIIHWFTSLFCQSFFLHRYCSHRMFEMNHFWERFFYFLTYICQGPSFLTPSAYSELHNQHHYYSDTDKDPHSPNYSKNIFTMMLKTYKVYMNAINLSAQASSAPRWKSLDKLGQSHFNIILWICIYISVYIFFEIPLFLYPLILIHCLIGPIQGAIVNWFGHKYGYRNYNTNDLSKNTLPVDFLLMGELYQNNHHRFGHNLNFACKWFELDLTYIIARALKSLKVIKL